MACWPRTRSTAPMTPVAQGPQPTPVRPARARHPPPQRRVHDLVAHDQPRRGLRYCPRRPVQTGRPRPPRTPPRRPPQLPVLATRRPGPPHSSRTISGSRVMIRLVRIRGFKQNQSASRLDLNWKNTVSTLSLLSQSVDATIAVRSCPQQPQLRPAEAAARSLPSRTATAPSISRGSIARAFQGCMKLGRA